MSYVVCLAGSTEAVLARVPDDYIARLKEEIVHLKPMLEALESGKLYVGDRDLGAVSKETEAWITHLKKTIAMHQAIVDANS
jgi:hypothetical protein